jgi:hypothetical protein
VSPSLKEELDLAIGTNYGSSNVVSGKWFEMAIAGGLLHHSSALRYVENVLAARGEQTRSV